ncbi:MAG: hypothetical protein M1358_02840 [Chloroflexi bacterium]|nr:hypothetical protein [Chloroflexota bacterium]
MGRMAPKDVRVILTADKIDSLPDKQLRVDPGNEEVDAMLRDYVRVLTSFGEECVLKVA